MSFPTRILLGAGALAQLPAELERLGIRRPLICTDGGLRKAGLLDRLSATLQGAGVAHAVFDGTDPNPTLANVEAGAEAFRAAQADGIIGLGGGAPIDLAKAIALRIHHHAPLETYDDLIGGDRHITANIPPIVAVPTTAGTGSEVGRSTVISLESTGRKTVIFSPHLLPACAVCDPELTRALPPRITAATGIDALTHCIEAYIGKGFHPLADALAIDGVRRVGRALVRAVKDGERDLEARTDMMIAAMQGAIAFQKALGACHALAHPLGYQAGLHHGTANALMLPHVLAFNREVARDRLADVAVALGELPGADPGALADAAIRRVAALVAEVGLPTRLRDAGIDAARWPALRDAMVPNALKDGTLAGNPREAGAEDLRGLYEAAY